MKRWVNYLRTGLYMAISSSLLGWTCPSVVTAHSHSPESPQFTSYLVTNLVANEGTARNYDPHLVNPWGLVISKADHLYASNNGSSLLTAYSGRGEVRDFVLNAHSRPTGLVTNNSHEYFTIPNTMHITAFIAATELTH